MTLKYLKYGYLLAYVLPVLVVAGYYIGGVGNVLNPLFIFLIIPLFDKMVGIDTTLLSNSEAELRKNDRFYKVILYVWIIIQLLFLCWGMYVVNELNYFWEYTLFILGSGLVTGGIGITIAHELGHKKSLVSKLASQFLLMMVGYMHFYIEHNKGHHVWVGTEKDPATAEKGQSFFAFWVQSVIGGYFHAWHIEKSRLNRKGIRILGLHNKMIWFTLLPIVFGGGITLTIYFLKGVWMAPLLFFAGQALIAFTLLELVNYVEHYGLKRKRYSDGSYERVDEFHSWNSSHIVSNFFLFQLQRHSDHHISAIKEYQLLKHIEASPQLPAGYPTMILLALIPHAWFRTVDPLLENNKSGHG